MFTERQIQIMNASLEIISKKGIQGLTIKNLSKSIGISEPAIYRHYESKTDILLNIIDYFIGNTENIFKEIKNKNITPLNKIKLIFKKHFEILAEKPSLVCLIFSEEMFINEDVLKKKITDLLLVNQKNLQNIIIEGQESGEIRDDIDSEVLGTVVMGTLRFQMKKWQFLQNSQNLIEEGEKYISSLNLILKK